MANAGRGARATLVFCGDGPCRASLEQKARDGGVKALWLGVQTPRETLTAIAAADLLVHPPPVEICGNVLAEAMALRTRIIAMRAGGNMEMLGATARLQCCSTMTAPRQLRMRY